MIVGQHVVTGLLEENEMQVDEIQNLRDIGALYRRHPHSVIFIMMAVHLPLCTP